jgi:peptide chain release factor 2
LPTLSARVAELDRSMNDPEFWKDKKRSDDALRESKTLKAKVEPMCDLARRIEETDGLLRMVKEEDDQSLVDEVAADLKELEAELSSREVETLFSGPDDSRGAILAIHPGAGGTESMDWAEMLLRMYTRYAERKGFEAKLLDLIPGEEAGVKSVSLEINGPNAYGHFKAESGVHRLVRISPFDSSSRRHTSFASVFVYPEIDEAVEIEVRSDDLQIDTFRASGAGGQHVNKTDSAVRITHIPTGIVVQCQNERSQFRNKENAMKILRARLYSKKLEEEREKFNKLMEGQKEIAWGSQIRSYVLHPYNLVKDHRTDEQTSDAHGVLDGNLDAFVDAYLHKNAAR